MMTDGPEIRSIEDSLSHGHDAAFRAEHLIALIIDDLNGSSSLQGSAGSAPVPANGIVSGVDRLAGRLEAIVRDLEHVRSKIVTNSPKNINPASRAPAPIFAGSTADGSAIGAGYAGRG